MICTAILYLNIPVIVGSSLSDKYVLRWENISIFLSDSCYVGDVQQQQKLCWHCWRQWPCQMHSNEAICSGDDHFFFQSPTEICLGVHLQSKLNCGIWSHYNSLRWETYTPKQWILVSILVSKLVDSVYCVLPYWRICQFVECRICQSHNLYIVEFENL